MKDNICILPQLLGRNASHALHAQHCGHLATTSKPFPRAGVPHIMLLGAV